MMMALTVGWGADPPITILVNFIDIKIEDHIKVIIAFEKFAIFIKMLGVRLYIKLY